MARRGAAAASVGAAGGGGGSMSNAVRQPRASPLERERRGEKVSQQPWPGGPLGPHSRGADAQPSRASGCDDDDDDDGGRRAGVKGVVMSSSQDRAAAGLGDGMACGLGGTRGPLAAATGVDVGSGSEPRSSANGDPGGSGMVPGTNRRSYGAMPVTGANASKRSSVWGSKLPSANSRATASGTGLVWQSKRHGAGGGGGGQRAGRAAREGHHGVRARQRRCDLAGRRGDVRANKRALFVGEVVRDGEERDCGARRRVEDRLVTERQHRQPEAASVRFALFVGRAGANQERIDGLRTDEVGRGGGGEGRVSPLTAAHRRQRAGGVCKESALHRVRTCMTSEWRLSAVAALTGPTFRMESR